MAIKPTIYKARIAVSNLDTNFYDTINLTIAQHPSETHERMMTRVLAYCFNVQEFLTFTKGLSAPDEPDIWAKTLDDQISFWCDVGEPAKDRLKKAVGRSKEVKVYSFNSKSDVWWSKGQSDFSRLDVSFYRFPWESIQALAGLVERTMDISVTITDNSAFIASDVGTCEVACEVLQANN